MKKITVTCLLLIAFFVVNNQGQSSSCRNRTLPQLAKEFGRAFEAKQIASLDVAKPFENSISIRIENSLAQNAKSKYEYKNVKNFTQFAKWLKSQEIDGLPGHSAGNLVNCKKGSCKYQMNGLLHNNLFLQKISVGMKKDGCPYIKSVYIIDGN